MMLLCSNVLKLRGICGNNPSSDRQTNVLQGVVSEADIFRLILLQNNVIDLETNKPQAIKSVVDLKRGISLI